MEIAGIRIDGRIMIDGPANNSEVWSDDIEAHPGASVTDSLASMFDGDKTTAYGSISGASPGTNPIKFHPSTVFLILKKGKSLIQMGFESLP